MSDFLSSISSSYSFTGDSISLGVGMFEGKIESKAEIKIPLKVMNRHGLISGATGTGKTKTFQMISEQLSEKGVPVLLMDIKGDLSGLAKEGIINPNITERMKKIGKEWTPKAFPVEFLTLSEDPGVKLKATVLEFGPVLFSKILDLNETQSSVISLVYKFCDDNKLPLLDLKDLKKVLQYLTTDGKSAMEAEYGSISNSTVGTILRKVVEIEEQGADRFFGEKSFDVEDLLGDNTSSSPINILRLSSIQDKPKLFSTFMLSMLAEIYSKFPEIGDADKPKLVIFIDEAHLIFNNSTPELLSQLETVVKLIRSKGVGIFFCTQQPTDIPADVLSQLGLKIQHSLRAFSANDRKAIKLTVDNFPSSKFYTLDKLITELGIGEALVTSLNEKGVPTEVVHTYLNAPRSRMDILTFAELQEYVSKSNLVPVYNELIDTNSAYEILMKRTGYDALGNVSAQIPVEKKYKTLEEMDNEYAQKQTNQPDTTQKQGGGLFDMLGTIFRGNSRTTSVGSQVVRQAARTATSVVTREITRGILGALTKR